MLQFAEMKMSDLANLILRLFYYLLSFMLTRRLLAEQPAGEVVCEHRTLEISCTDGEVIDVQNALYGRNDTTICPGQNSHITNCKADNSLSIVKGRCENENSCSVLAGNSVFGDPCVGVFKYLQVEYSCEPAADCERHCLLIYDPVCGSDGETYGNLCEFEAAQCRFPTLTYTPGECRDGEVVCEHRTLEISCSDGEVIKVEGALYGRKDTAICPGQNSHITDCEAEGALSIVNERCENENSCSVLAGNSVFGDPCVGVFKYLQVHYSCEPAAAPGTCVVWGDPHYVTFDNVKYDFQGDCEYTLIEVCNNTGDLADFRLVSNNKRNRPGDRVSFLREISLIYNDVVYELVSGGGVTIDEVAITLPYITDDVSIFLNNPNIILTTSFGLTVQFNRYTDVKIELSSAYRKNVCGLCGDFNGNRENEFYLPDGSQAPSPTDFGNSWYWAGEGCSGNPVDPCEEGSDDYNTAVQACSYLLLTDGEFSACHAYVEPQAFYDACVYDLCAMLPERGTICSSFASYADSCRADGGTPGPWRGVITQCALSCPSGLAYDPCAPGCPATCVEPERPDDCQIDDCQEACRCPDGHVLDGDRCVTVDQCGCPLSNGQYLSQGDTYVSNYCTEHCTCDGGSLDCFSMECDENAICDVRDGIRDCYCEAGFVGEGQNCVAEPLTGAGTCVIWGDPHYVTFDNVKYDFQGDCEYTLIEVCNNTGDLVDFRLVSNNKRNNPGDRVSFLREISLIYNDVVYELISGGGVTIDEVAITLPYITDDVSIFLNPPNIILTTSFGLTVQFNQYTDVKIELSPVYRDAVCGLCGDYNSDQDNEFTIPDTGVDLSPTEFGNSWFWTGEPGCRGDPVDPCEEGSDDYNTAVRECSYLLSVDDEFSVCHEYVGPQAFYDACVYDLCAMLPDRGTLCSSFASYADRCRAAGGTPGPWRGVITNCALTCPTGLVYDSCAPGCPATCVEPEGPGDCQIDDCQEACRCPEGYVLDGDRCVTVDQCGCQLSNGQYISQGDTYVSNDCTEYCTCDGGSLDCFSYECDENASCDIRDGMPACYCEDGFVGDGQTCVPACDELQKCPKRQIFNRNTCQCECRPKKCRGRRYLDQETCQCKCYPIECAEGYAYNPRTCSCRCQRRSCRKGFVFDRRCCECTCRRYKMCEPPLYFSKATCQCEGDLIQLPGPQ